MIVHQGDAPAVQWAVEHGYPFGYVREHGLPDPSLQIHLGLSIACFKGGYLVHWRAMADGERIDELMKELASLFGFCTIGRGYSPEEVLRPNPRMQRRTGSN